ncbi:MAG: ABC transporter substrate-binding protein [Pseudonocardiaceae bacterium]|nr:ABC transporter substrate-binding protein [Pseudonocardiaceae bacterium]
MRRIPALVMLVVLVSAVLAACGGGQGGAPGGAGTDEPIRIGVLAPLTGAQSTLGQEEKRGADLAAKMLNEDGGVLGRPIELVYRDGQGSPAEAVQIVRDFANEDINFTLGYVSSAQCLAVTPVAEQLGVLVMSSYCQTTKVTGSEFTENFFRATTSAEMLTRAGAQAIVQEDGDIAEWSSISPDYEYGHITWTIFKNQMELLVDGFEVVGEVWPPFQAASFSDHITKLNNSLSGHDQAGIFSSLYSGDMINMLSQAAPIGLVEGHPFLMLGTDLDAIRPLGQAGNVPTAWISVAYYHEAFDNPVNTEFVKAFQAEYGVVPIGYNATAFMSVTAYAAAIEKAGSTEVQAVHDALEGLTWQTPLGETTIRAEDHQAMFESLAMFKIAPADNEQGFEVTDVITIPGQDVSSPPHPGEVGEFSQ